jgi:CDP-paratose 2-epimerase
MKKIFITGGSGFIGINTALFFIKKKYKVKIFDNLSRKGSRANLKYLDNKIIFERGNIENFEKLKKSIKKFKPSLIINCAGQVAVTTSIVNPRLDFNSNALGTFNILEVVRNLNYKCRIIHLSTNKVYGDLSENKIIEKKLNYSFIRSKKGIDEKQNLDFKSPYGCSKGASDQYVLDYHKSFNVDGIVLRQSCIYGNNQFGIEDQGWIAWMTLCVIFEKRINIFGNGKQVRDILHVKDLVNLFYLISKKKTLKSRVYNVGGGINNSLSILELINYLKKFHKKNISVKYFKERIGDQKIYISNINKAKKELNWKPHISKIQGIKLIYDWIKKNKKEFSKALII